MVAMHLLSLLGTASLLAGSAYAKYDCSESNDVCISEWRFCSDDGCSFPENVWPVHADPEGRLNGGDEAIIDRQAEYNITWKPGMGGRNFAVAWAFPGSFESVDSYWGRGYWLANTTNRWYIFKPDEIIKSFPNDRLLNWTEEDIASRAADFSTLRVSELTDNGLVLDIAMTSQFSVQNGVAITALKARDTRRSWDERRWKIGVGVGVGVGAPVMMAAVWIAAGRHTKKKLQKGSPVAKAASES